MDLGRAVDAAHSELKYNAIPSSPSNVVKLPELVLYEDVQSPSVATLLKLLSDEDILSLAQLDEDVQAWVLGDLPTEHSTPEQRSAAADMFANTLLSFLPSSEGTLDSELVRNALQQLESEAQQALSQSTADTSPTTFRQMVGRSDGEDMPVRCLFPEGGS